MNNALKLCVVTGSRAEYGLFLPLLREIKNHDNIELILVVTGMHLSPEFGLTYKFIEQDGFKIDEKLELLMSSDTDVAMSKSTGIGLLGFSDIFNRLKPDWILLLGDRFETFSAAISAHFLKIPIAHIHGGELTEGAIDDSIRHSITKLSYLHFAATEEYRNRIVQLGESPERVFNVGALGVDAIRMTNFVNLEDLNSFIGLDLGKDTILLTVHPETLENNATSSQLEALLSAIEMFDDLQVVVTKANADSGGRLINQRLTQFVGAKSNCRKIFESLGQVRYYSLLRYIKAVVGNSSSGIIEAPTFQVSTVNIGNRQKGRVRAKSVIDVAWNPNEIFTAIKYALSETFREGYNNSISPYGDGNACKKIIQKILFFGKISSVAKSFYDVPINDGAF